MNTNEFDEIRPYYSNELPGVFEELIADPMFGRAVAAALPQMTPNEVFERMRQCKTIKDFQYTLCYALMRRLERDFTSGLSMGNVELLDKQKAYTYISNHRDIVLDSAFLSLLLVEAGMDSVEIAIGDNLLIYPWIKKLVRVNKSFIVQRGLSMRQMLVASARLSRYVQHTIQNKNQSIWIAQREGRAKDSNDQTQESVLKMLAMSGEGTPVERMMRMNIMPLSISYQYDPCDYLKAMEYQLKRDEPDYKKTTADDLLNMRTGLTGFKGYVHFQPAGCINGELAKLDSSLSKQEQFAAVAQIIDKAIYLNYRFYPQNYVAHDLLGNTSRWAGECYSAAERKGFEDYISSRLMKIDIPCKDEDFLRHQLLLMYANPLTNYLKASGKV